MGVGELFEFERIGRSDPEPRVKRWRSIAVWPDTIRVGHTVGKNESDDTHRSRSQAEAVCKLLRVHGFGGKGEIFPISTRVEPVEPTQT